MNDIRYDYEFEPGRLYPHEVAILGSGGFDGFFPTTFLFGSGRVTAVYDCGGYAPLAGFRIEYTSDILFILEKVLLILHRSSEFLILSERILILPETVFYSQQTGGVKITYIPVSGEADLHTNLLEFLARIQVDLCDPYGKYIDRFAIRSKKENLDTSSMLTLVGVLRRELDAELSQL